LSVDLSILIFRGSKNQTRVSVGSMRSTQTMLLVLGLVGQNTECCRTRTGAKRSSTST
jgi:hypothetical protein